VNKGARRFANASWGMGMRSHFWMGDRMVGNGDARSARLI